MKNKIDLIKSQYNKNMTLELNKMKKNLIKTIGNNSKNIKDKTNNIEQFKDENEYKNILVLMRRLFENWEERNKYLVKRFFIRKWFMQVKRLKERDAILDNSFNIIDKKFLEYNVIIISYASEIKRINNAITVVRAADFFTNLRRLWGDWDKIRRRILCILGKYIESEEEKRIYYLKKRLLQWKDKAQKVTKENAKNRIAKWSNNKYKIKIARQNWIYLSNKYNICVKKVELFDLISRLRYWLILRDMAKNIRNRLTVVGMEQYKEGVDFKKILILMRTLFELWEERNKFLAKRFFIRKWFMQVKRLKERDAILDNSFNIIDKKFLEYNVIIISYASEIKKINNAITVARAADFFNNLRRLWRDWVIIRRRILCILAKSIEIKDEKIINYIKEKLFQWKDNAKKLTKEISGKRIGKYIKNIYRITTVSQKWRLLSIKYDIFIQKTVSSELKRRIRNWLKLRDMSEKLKNRFTIVGIEQLKDGVQYEKILVIMRILFENLEERNKFLAKRYFIRKWYMQVKRLRQRDYIFDKQLKIIDNKFLENSIIIFSYACEIKRINNAITVARAKDFFIKLRKIWDDNIYEIKEEELIQKYNEITQLNIKFKENENYYNQIKKENTKLKEEILRFPLKLFENEYIILLIIMTKDEKVIFPLMCKNTDKFNKIKEIFFEEFPEYSKNKGKFYKGHKMIYLNSNKTLEEINIKSNDIIIFDSK